MPKAVNNRAKTPAAEQVNEGLDLALHSLSFSERGMREDYSTRVLGVPNTSCSSALDLQRQLMGRAKPLSRAEQHELLVSLNEAQDRGLIELARQPIFLIHISERLDRMALEPEKPGAINHLFVNDQGSRGGTANESIDGPALARGFFAKRDAVTKALQSTERSFAKLQSVRDEGGSATSALARYRRALGAIATIVKSSGINRSFRVIDGFRLIHRKEQELRRIVDRRDGQLLREFEKSIMMSASEFLDRTTAIRVDVPELKSRVVIHNMRLVSKSARIFENWGMSQEDLLQEGFIALDRAADKFDPSMGFTFSTYAMWWIRHCCTKAIQDGSRTVRHPGHRWEERLSERRSAQALEHRLGRKPTVEERAQEFGVSRGRLERLLVSFAAPLSLDIEMDTGSSDSGGRSLLETLADDKIVPADESMIAKRPAAVISKLFEAAKLNPRSLEVITRRLLTDPPESLQTVGDRFGISRERVRQIQEKAIRELRAISIEHGITLEELF